MSEDHNREAEAEALEAEIAEVCGTLNVAAGRLVSLITQVLATESWAGVGIHSPEQWVAWQCGVSLGRARSLVRTARRLPELPETASALATGELSEDQVGVIARHAPSHADAEVATLGRSATVAQLRRALSRYVFPTTKPDAADEATPEPEPDEPRHVDFGFDDDGRWRMTAVLPPDEGALVERALAAARQKLLSGAGDSGGGDTPTRVTWADALAAVAEGYLAGEAVARPHYDRHLVVVHVGTDDEGTANGHLHLGPALPDSLRRYLSCDAKGRVQLDAHGTPLSVGRSARIVPARTRVAIEERDGACRVPGCERTKWLHVHHLRHWEDGGTTDTDNLIALCSKHHRQHHRGGLGIFGNADEPDGVVFTDAPGRPLAQSGRPAPPQELTPAGQWTHPTGERLDLHWVNFKPPSGWAPPPVPTGPIPQPQARGEVDYAPCINLDDPIYGATDDDFSYAG